MNISLRMNPGSPGVSWESFLRESPPYSIALDGYVAREPLFDPDGPRVNFNHHERVDRLATRSTCGQVLMAIRQGLFKRFRDAEGIRAEVWGNDCDEDFCTAWFLLKNPHLVEAAMNPALNRLVSMEDALDCTAGAYPFPPDLPALGELAWVFEPYRRFRLGGGLDRKRVEDFVGVVTDVEHRIMRHVTGHGQAISLDTRYERIGGGAGWVMVKELGAQARTGMFADGIQAFVSVRERPDGRWVYTIGRLSPFIPFDVLGLADFLNDVEGATTDAWGGATNIVGSPRAAGSGLSPEELTRVIESALHP